MVKSCFLGALSANKVLEKRPFVDPANAGGPSFAEPQLSKSAVDMKRVKGRLEF
jgi:hypothetical protein